MPLVVATLLQAFACANCTVFSSSIVSVALAVVGVLAVACFLRQQIQDVLQRMCTATKHFLVATMDVLQRMCTATMDFLVATMDVLHSIKWREHWTKYKHQVVGMIIIICLCGLMKLVKDNVTLHWSYALIPIGSCCVILCVFCAKRYGRALIAILTLSWEKHKQQLGTIVVICVCVVLLIMMKRPLSHVKMDSKTTLSYVTTFCTYLLLSLVTFTTLAVGGILSYFILSAIVPLVVKRGGQVCSIVVVLAITVSSLWIVWEEKTEIIAAFGFVLPWLIWGVMHVLGGILYLAQLIDYVCQWISEKKDQFESTLSECLQQGPESDLWDQLQAHPYKSIIKMTDYYAYVSKPLSWPGTWVSIIEKVVNVGPTARLLTGNYKEAAQEDTDNMHVKRLAEFLEDVMFVNDKTKVELGSYQSLRKSIKDADDPDTEQSTLNKCCKCQLIYFLYAYVKCLCRSMISGFYRQVALRKAKKVLEELTKKKQPPNNHLVTLLLQAKLFAKNCTCFVDVLALMSQRHEDFGNIFSFMQELDSVLAGFIIFPKLWKPSLDERENELKYGRQTLEFMITSAGDTGV